jgi:hypothetical protein
MATEEQPTADFNGSSRQREFIEDLVDKIGYRDAPTREKFLHRVLERCRDRDGTSDVTDWLLEQLALRRNTRPVDARGKTIASTDLATFAFCPASYAIEKTFGLPPSVQMMAGKVKHKERKLESFLDGVRRKREREFEDGTADSGFEDEESFVYRGDYGEVLRWSRFIVGTAATTRAPSTMKTARSQKTPTTSFAVRRETTSSSKRSTRGGRRERSLFRYRWDRPQGILKTPEPQPHTFLDGLQEFRNSFALLSCICHAHEIYVRF